MGCGPCCPGRPQSKRIRIGLQEVGIADLERIFGEVLSLSGISDEELRAFLLDKVRACNYIPPAMEAEYTDAIWNAFLTERSQRERSRRQ